MKRPISRKGARWLRVFAARLSVAVLVAFLGFGLILGTKNFLREREARSALSQRGVDGLAVIVGRQVKACFGWVCNSPKLFEGGRGDRGYSAFAAKNCFEGRSRNCHYILKIAFKYRGKLYVTSPSVLEVRFQEMRPQQVVRIRFDQLNPTTLKIIGDGKGDPDYYAFMFIIGAGLFSLWLWFGIAVNRRRERRGWGTGGYA